MVPAILTTDDVWEFTINATDVDELTYSVDFGDGNGPVVQDSPAFSHSWERVGTYDVRVRVTDGEGGGDYQSFELEVLQGKNSPDLTPPEVVQVTRELVGDQLTSVTVRFSEDVSASLHDGPRLRLRNAELGVLLRLQNGAWNGEDNSVTWDLLARTLCPGIYTLTLPDWRDITDAAGNNIEQSIEETVVVPLAGDVNLDGRVNATDFLVLSRNFNRDTDVSREEGDLDHDGTVTVRDFLILSKNFGRSLPAE